VTEGTPDRRQNVRFEVVGELWGSLATTVAVRVRNVSQGGMLVESPRPLPGGVAYQVRVTSGGTALMVPARICHTRDGDGAASSYLVGFEFFDVPDEAARWFAGLAARERPAGRAEPGMPT
jgi:hypothetical protein